MKILDVDSAVALLEQHPDYRVLRKFKPRGFYAEPTGAPVRCGIYVDSETDGTDVEKCNLLELALVPFAYEETGRILGVYENQCTAYLNDPGVPLTDEIRRLTGIADEDLAGQSLNLDEIEQTLANADLVVAHNAFFDRRVVERFVPKFRDLPWACSQQEVPWLQSFHSPAARLEVIAHFVSGVFYGAHRAMIDCLIGVHVLATATDSEGRTAFQYLLESSSSESIRIWAVGAPFHAKDDLKRRGYSWNDGRDGRPKAWHKRIPLSEQGEESQWLRNTCGAYPQVTVTEAVDRYSVRET
jgi:DNA polymerase-3 subunit epsilon